MIAAQALWDSEFMDRWLPTLIQIGVLLVAIVASYTMVSAQASQNAAAIKALSSSYERHRDSIGHPVITARMNGVRS